ncbi:MAG: hypothetical protein KIS66_10785 [Fimbriimonadaceae bacterium]|nr:hypothetical protein [Fimbriimonadaceae bacterium]
MTLLSDGWTVDYGQGPTSVTVPHAWCQDIPVAWEGPALYRRTVEVPTGGGWIVFEGVSYAAQVLVNGELVGGHQGLYDAFSFDLSPWSGRTVDLTVQVVKNGGPTYPVRDVLSGFIPFVFHTFGGIYREVWLVDGVGDPTRDPDFWWRLSGYRTRPSASPVEPFYMRGVLTWGWYPELGHLNPPDEAIVREIAQARALGFNTVKFCLWVPSHRYLRLLHEAGMKAWIELPLWAPSSDPDKQARMEMEIEQIVRQYRHHPAVVCWTVGCELTHETSAEFRERVTRTVGELTGCPLVKDNSGGAEMYGGDLREFGSFYDFHPYCDTPFYPVVLDSLLPGARREAPILLGEFNDVDVHRDLPRLKREAPYWSSQDPALNDPGVRWQHDLPGFLSRTRFAEEGPKHRRLMRSSREKALFMRKYVHEAVRARDPIHGYVITGWRDTPISTAGVVDDEGALRYSAEETVAWNGENCLFLLPTRRPPWLDGGNRPGWLDPFCFHPGQAFWRLGIHTERAIDAKGRWWIEGASGILAEGSFSAATRAMGAQELAEIAWEAIEPGVYTLGAAFGETRNTWSFEVVPKPDWTILDGWARHDPRRRLADLPLPELTAEAKGLVATGWHPSVASLLERDMPAVLLLDREGTVSRPFWREAAYEPSEDPFWTGFGAWDRWERWLAVSGDAALDPEALRRMGFGDRALAPVLTRIDTRTYEELPVIARLGSALVTSLRPDGGLGVQPHGVSRNPSGAALLRALACVIREL